MNEEIENQEIVNQKIASQKIASQKILNQENANKEIVNNETAEQMNHVASNNDVENDYVKSIYMWNDVYAKCKLTDLSQKQLSVEPTFDICLDLFASECKTVLDYGCGTGDVILQIYQFGNLSKGLGLDLSKTGIEYAKKITEISGYHSLDFQVGGIEKLKTIDDQSFDGIVLSNVLDVTPREVAVQIFDELTRILKKNGMMFVKLNPFYDEKSLEDFGLIKFKDNLYEENGVLRLREMDTSQWKHAFEKYYEIERYLEFPYPWQEGMNRLFLLKKR